MADCPDHVIYYEELNGVRPSKTADILIGVFLLLVVFTGIGGNIAALAYFWKRRDDNLSKLLYTIISITDICTSTVTIAVIPTLFKGRRPGLFRSYGICGAFSMLFKHLQRFSMYMVMMISVTRTIAIFKPFYKIRKKGVVVACLAFEIFWIAVDVAFLASGSLQMVYYAPAASCGVIPGVGVQIWTWNFYIIIFLLWLVLGTLFVLISLILSLRTVAGMRKRSTIQNAKVKKFVDVSLTITLFTAAFLLCNLPLLILQTWANIVYFIGTEADYENKNDVYGWYGLVIAHVFLTTFNAASNPCLYLTRMLKYRAWLRSKLSRQWRRVTTLVSDYGLNTINFHCRIKTEN